MIVIGNEELLCHSEFSIKATFHEKFWTHMFARHEPPLLYIMNRNVLKPFEVYTWCRTRRPSFLPVGFYEQLKFIITISTHAKWGINIQRWIECNFNTTNLHKTRYDLICTLCNTNEVQCLELQEFMEILIVHLQGSLYYEESTKIYYIMMWHWLKASRQWLILCGISHIILLSERTGNHRNNYRSCKLRWLFNIRDVFIADMKLKR